MIITTTDEWTDLYRSIREESSRSDEKHVFIYACSSDVDSVCALRILEVRCPTRRRMGWLGSAGTARFQSASASRKLLLLLLLLPS